MRGTMFCACSIDLHARRRFTDLRRGGGVYCGAPGKLHKQELSFDLIANPWFWVAAVFGVILTGISKGGLGGGAAGIAVPLMALVIPPAQGAAIMLPILCVMDLAGIKAYLGKWDRRILRVIVPAGLVGTLIGTFTFRHLNDSWIRILLGVIALGFLAYSLVPRGRPPAPPSDRQGGFWAMVSGFTSFVSHAGGPPLMVYLLPQKMEKEAFIATSLVFFAAMNYSKILPYFWLGLFDPRNLATSLALMAPGVAGIYLGVWLQSRISVTGFYRIIYTLMFLTGTKLLYDGITGL
jgi:uncharacterized protein